MQPPEPEIDPVTGQPIPPATEPPAVVAATVAPINADSLAVNDASPVTTPAPTLSSTDTAILSYLEKALALLQVLEATGVVKTPDAQTITTLVTDIEGVIASTNAPTTALIERITQLLTDLQKLGIIGGTVVTTIASGLLQFSAFVSDIKSGQVGIIKSHTALDGVEGLYCFVPYGGPAAEALGL